MPTLGGLAGYKADRDLKWDGRDIWPVLAGQDKPGSRTLYWLGTGRNSRAVRDGDWKLFVPKNGEPELYNLAADPAESRNLAVQQPERVVELRKKLTEQAARDDDALAKD
jgi:arylsulfatase A-like enzyme